MPPIRSQSSQKRIEQEGRILLAIQTFQNNNNCSICQLARDFDVSATTLTRRIAGVKSREETRANSHKLTFLEEETLVNWIISLDERGAAPRPNTVREVANLLLEDRGTDPIESVGVRWVYNFIQRHPDLCTRFSRSYDYWRAQFEDVKMITTRSSILLQVRPRNTASSMKISTTSTRPASHLALLLLLR
jgi:transposase-like protein